MWWVDGSDERDYARAQEFVAGTDIALVEFDLPIEAFIHATKLATERESNLLVSSRAVRQADAEFRRIWEAFNDAENPTDGV